MHICIYAYTNIFLHVWKGPKPFQTCKKIFFLIFKPSIKLINIIINKNVWRLKNKINIYYSYNPVNLIKP